MNTTELTTPRQKVAWAVLGVVAVGGIVHSSPAAWTAPQPITVSQPLAGSRSATVQLDVGTARVSVTAGAAAGLLAQGQVEPGRGMNVERNVRHDGAAAIFTLAETPRSGISHLLPRQGSRWNLRLARGVPLDLVVHGGVGEVGLDLSRLTVRSLDLDAGVGSLDVTLPRTGALSGTVRSGVGAVTVRVPEGVAARIRARRGLGGVEAGPGFVRDGDVYRTVTSGTPWVNLMVDAGIGGVQLQIVP